MGLAPDRSRAGRVLPPAAPHRRVAGGDVLEVDAHFRDSVWGPDHDELALHEYSLTATIDEHSGVLRSIAVDPRVLPFPECPAAAPHAGTLVGTDVTSLRAGVQRVLTD